MIETIKLANVVGTGNLDRELDLDAVHDDIIKQEPVKKAKRTDIGLNITFTEKTGTLIVFRSGKYNIMGCSSVEDLRQINSEFLDLLNALEISCGPESANVEVNNYVYSVELDQGIDLTKLESLLGTAAVYEPEQNPFLIFKPNNINGTMTVSNSGKCVVNTPDGENTVHKMVEVIDGFSNQI